MYSQKFLARVRTYAAAGRALNRDFSPTVLELASLEVERLSEGQDDSARAQIHSDVQEVVQREMHRQDIFVG